MAIQSHDKAALRQIYLATTKDLCARSREFLRATKLQGSQSSQSPESDLSICVDGAEVYRQNLGTGRVKVQRYTPVQARKLQTAIDRPETLIGEVAIIHDARPLHINVNGQIHTDSLQILRLPERGSSRGLTQPIGTYLTSASQGRVAFPPPFPPGRRNSAIEEIIDISPWQLAIRAITHKNIPWILLALLMASLLSMGIIFRLNDTRSLGMQAEKLEKELAKAHFRGQAEARRASAVDRQEGQKMHKAEVVHLNATNLDEAVSLVENLYRQLSQKRFDRAVALYGPTLKGTFSPGFFKQFRQVTVENLQLTATTTNSISLRGENTYTYLDGSSQREVRSYTVSSLDGQLRVVSSGFVEILQYRR